MKATLRELNHTPAPDESGTPILTPSPDDPLSVESTGCAARSFTQAELDAKKRNDWSTSVGVSIHPIGCGEAGIVRKRNAVHGIPDWGPALVARGGFAVVECPGDDVGSAEEMAGRSSEFSGRDLPSMVVELGDGAWCLEDVPERVGMKEKVTAVQWCANHMADDRVPCPPNREAWSMFVEARSSPAARAEFWKGPNRSLLPKQGDLGKVDRMADDGREVLKTLQEMKAELDL